MSAIASLQKFVGQWSGTSRLWLPPDEFESASTARVALTAQGKFVTVEYTWAFKGEPQQGFFLLGYEPASNAVESAWADSWHMSDKMLLCPGSVDGGGAITVHGSYAAPTGPDWGWRTVIEPGAGDSFQIIMYNVMPSGEEMLAFKNVYAR